MPRPAAIWQTVDRLQQPATRNQQIRKVHGLSPTALLTACSWRKHWPPRGQILAFAWPIFGHAVAKTVATAWPIFGHGVAKTVATAWPIFGHGVAKTT